MASVDFCFIVSARQWTLVDMDGSWREDIPRWAKARIRCHTWRVSVPESYIHRHTSTHTHTRQMNIWDSMLHMASLCTYLDMRTIIHLLYEYTDVEQQRLWRPLSSVQFSERSLETCAHYAFEPLGMGQSVGVPMDPPIYADHWIWNHPFCGVDQLIIIDSYPSVLFSYNKSIQRPYTGPALSWRCLILDETWHWSESCSTM